MMRRTGTSAAISLILMTIIGCEQAPAVDVMGSLFPAWLLCIALRPNQPSHFRNFFVASDGV
jgi:hypothetical protein